MKQARKQNKKNNETLRFETYFNYFNKKKKKTVEKITRGKCFLFKTSMTGLHSFPVDIHFLFL